MLTYNLEEKPVKYAPKTLFNEKQEKKFKQYFSSFLGNEERMGEDMKFRSKTYKIKEKERQKIKIHNHFKNNFIVGNKKALFQVMNSYYTSINEDVF